MRTWWMVFALAVAPLAATAAPPEAPLVRHEVSAERSVVYVVVRPKASSLFSGFSHSHVVRASALVGHITFAPLDPSRCEVQLEALVSAFEVDDPALRKRAGLDGALDDDDRREVREHMLAEGQLHATQHPRVTYRARRCTSDAPGRLRVSGQLSVRGVTQDVALPIRYEKNGDTLTASGEVSILGTQFGIEPFSAGLGTIKNDDLIRLVLDLVAIAPAPADIAR